MRQRQLYYKFQQLFLLQNAAQFYYKTRILYAAGITKRVDYYKTGQYSVVGVQR